MITVAYKQNSLVYIGILKGLNDIVSFKPLIFHNKLELQSEFLYVIMYDDNGLDNYTELFMLTKSPLVGPNGLKLTVDDIDNTELLEVSTKVLKYFYNNRPILH